MDRFVSATEAQVIAFPLHDLGNTTIFSVVLVPVTNTTEPATNIGILLMCLRDE